MPNSRLDAARAWLTQTLAGRLLIAGVALKLVAWVGVLIQWRPGVFNALDTLGGLAILVSALAIGYRVYVIARHRLLWRVRRKLILSYIFIGVVPVLLVADLLHPWWAAVLLQRQRIHASQPRRVGRGRRAVPRTGGGTHARSRGLRDAS